jgi:endonuclease/exonuclease/phosphatase family metal-dependent hydrolase
MPNHSTTERLWRAGVLSLLVLLTSCATTERRVEPEIYRHAEIGPSQKAVRTASPHTLRVMTLNIAHGRGDSFHQLFQSTATTLDNLDVIAMVLKREAPDVASLQETDIRSFWNGNMNQVDFLARYGSFDQSVRGAHVDSLGLSYGTAMVANLELENAESVTFNPRRTALPKGFVVSTVAWPDSECIEVDIVSVHLDFARESTRREQAAELIATLRSRNRPVIVMGDFNTDWRQPDSALRLIADELGLRTHEPEDPAQVTFPSSGERLDWILVSPEISFSSYRVVGDVVSDHFGVLSDLVIDRNCEYAASY